MWAAAQMQCTAVYGWASLTYSPNTGHAVVDGLNEDGDGHGAHNGKAHPASKLQLHTRAKAGRCTASRMQYRQMQAAHAENH